MVFSSILFTFVFLPFVLLFYYIAKDKYRNYILLVASILFYTIGEGKGVCIMLLSIFCNYAAGLLVDRIEKTWLRRAVFIADIAGNLLILYFFKYMNYTISLIDQVTGKDIPGLPFVLPIGISFFTFQAISYVADVYKKDVPAEKNVLNVGLYISFFPQLVAGPIVRYNSIAEQIQHRTIDLDKFGSGVKRFLTGFCKKVILANNLALVAEEAFQYSDLHELPVSLAWLGSIAFTLQIFFDFAGYSDMAIGLGRMFGFEFEENFNYPYISKSVTEFWRRWHISLSRWFRDYVYIPLGGSRVRPWRHILNLLVVWLLTGIWHGANVSFLLWGIMYFVVLLFEKYILHPEQRKNAVIRIIWQVITLLIVNCGWILFNMESVVRTGMFYKALVGAYGNVWCNDVTLRLLREYGIYMAAGLIFSTPIVPALGQRLEKNSTGKLISSYVVPILYLLLFLWAVSFLILGAHNPFIYFNF